MSLAKLEFGTTLGKSTRQKSVGLHICKAFFTPAGENKDGFWLWGSYESPSNVGACTARTKLASLAPGSHENLHPFAPAGNLAPTKYCQKCHSLQSGTQPVHHCATMVNGLVRAIEHFRVDYGIFSF